VRRRGYGTIFWPAILILAGLVALLVNTGVVPVDSLIRLTDLWPLILIVIGLELMARRSLVGRPAEVATALIVIVAVAGAAIYVAIAPALPGGNQTLDASDVVGSLNQAQLELDTGGATIKIHGSGDLGGDLYRAHINYSGEKPTVSLDRQSQTVTISQNTANFPLFSTRRFAVDLQITTQVPWRITTNSGAATETLDLSLVDVRKMEIDTGASHDDITLGAPHGDVPISVSGGALTVNLHRPGSTDARVSVSGGAVNLNADNHHSSTFGDASWQSNGYDNATDRYTIDVNGGACTVTMEQV
jgi:NADH:ubiquinone oxidoreductase subunit K